jgi:2-methylcitrate dehydratase PrpD
VASRIAAEPAATTLYGGRTSPDMAAFVNGILVRYLDFNDTYLSKEPAHPSDNLAAVLAAGEVSGASGSDLISAAVALQDGEVGLDQFSEERIADPALLALVSRVEVEPDRELSARYPASTPNRVTVTTRSGESVSREVEFPRGYSGNPMTDDEVEKKFRRLAEREIPPRQQAEVLRRLWSLEAEADLRSLLALFRRSE